MRPISSSSSGSQALGGHPQMRKVIHDLGLAGCGRQDERGALPVGEITASVNGVGGD
jgi:hypothetical protein